MTLIAQPTGRHHDGSNRGASLPRADKGIHSHHYGSWLLKAGSMAEAIYLFSNGRRENKWREGDGGGGEIERARASSDSCTLALEAAPPRATSTTSASPYATGGQMSGGTESAYGLRSRRGETTSCAEALQVRTWLPSRGGR